MAKYFLLASTVIGGALMISLPASAAITGLEAVKADPAVIATTSDYKASPSTLLVHVADDDDQGSDNDSQGDDNDSQGGDNDNQ